MSRKVRFYPTEAQGKRLVGGQGRVHGNRAGSMIERAGSVVGKKDSLVGRADSMVGRAGAVVGIAGFMVDREGPVVVKAGSVVGRKDSVSWRAGQGSQKREHQLAFMHDQEEEQTFINRVS